MPRTLVHGDFIKRNLRVRPVETGPDLLPFDWEDSGWGVPAVDLAWRPLGASADLIAYWEVVRHHWPGVDLPTVRRWAALGTLFRSLAGADWDAPKLATPWVQKGVMRLTIYQDALADALRALGWEDGLTPASRSQLPDLAALTAGLTRALQTVGDGDGPLTVVERRRNPNTSTFPSEVVTCRLGNDGELRLFCKYGAGRDHNAHGHRGGVAYEAEVYQHVVDPSRLPAPRYHGTHDADGAAGEVWLFLGYLDGATRLRDTKDPFAWDLAARWIGGFHAAHEGGGPQLPFLRAYDAAYYTGWARRAAEAAGPLHRDHPWLAPLCQNFEAALAPLLEAPQTVIHGEYYPKNILCVGGVVYPVDWESAAVAPGEIDLATLTDRCDADVLRRCELAYRQARWPGGEGPPDFERTMSLARLYVHFRWLGDRPDRMKPWRLEELRALGERLGLL
jgi:aminoglycoside phosphotransferase (APT) family kinase protein